MEVVPYSSMAHHLCDVRFVLAAKTLFWDAQAFTNLCERPCNKTIKPLFIADIRVMVKVISWLGCMDAHTYGVPHRPENLLPWWKTPPVVHVCGKTDLLLTIPF